MGTSKKPITVWDAMTPAKRVEWLYNALQRERQYSEGLEKRVAALEREREEEGSEKPGLYLVRYPAGPHHSAARLRALLEQAGDKAVVEGGSG